MEAFDAATLSPEQLDAICPCSPADRAAFVIPSLATTDSADLRTYLQELLLPYDDTLHAIDRELKYIHRKLGVLRINSDGKCAPVERMEDGGYRHHFWDSSRLKLGYADYQLFMMSLRKEPPKDIAMFYLDHYAEHRFEQGIVPPSRHRRDPVELRARRQRLKENQWLFKLQNENPEVRQNAVNALLHHERIRTDAWLQYVRRNGLMDKEQIKEIHFSNTKKKQREDFEAMGESEKVEYLASLYKEVVQNDLRRWEEARSSRKPPEENNKEDEEEEELTEIGQQPADEMDVDADENDGEGQETGAQEPPEHIEDSTLVYGISDMVLD